MSKLSILLITLFVAATQAFVPASQIRSPQPAFVAMKDSSSFALNMAEDTYWDGEYPPSSVLGPIMSKMPSGALGMMSLVFLVVCAYSIAETSVLVREPGAFESGAWVKWYYVLGSFCGPLSWGTHVACWIQRKNGN
jgi:hypothetical protein